MLHNMFNQLLIMSVIAGGLYLILKLLSTLTLKYFTAAWHYYTNIAIYMFFLLPYHKWMSWLDLSFVKTSDKGFSLPTITGLNPPTALSLTANDIATLQEESYAGASVYFELLPYLLMAGTLIFIAVILIQNYNLNRRIFRMCRSTADEQTLTMLFKCKQEMSIAKEIPVYVSPCISTPFLSGIFKPRIVLPDIEFNTEELQCVFLHELTHWKRHDAWLKYLMLFINAIHWFNPLAYMARHDVDRFCELSCDESVVKSMNNQERRRYCELMLNVLWNVADQNVKLFSAFSDKRKQLERRVNMILKNEGLKSKKWVRMFAIVITLVIASFGVVVAYAAYAGNTLISEQPSLKQDSIQEKIVLIDPGHGGDDAGAIYTEGNNAEIIKEKELNLKISLLLQDMLKESGVRAELTRQEDQEISLEGRMKLAENFNASLLVSVHFESNPHPAMKGTWTQYNSSNNTAVYGITGQKAAQLIHNVVVKELGTEGGRIAPMSKSLKYDSLKMPAMSIALAVMSNASDRESLMTEEFSLEAAKALHDGIIAVLNEM